MIDPAVASVKTTDVPAYFGCAILIVRRFLESGLAFATLGKEFSKEALMAKQWTQVDQKLQSHRPILIDATGSAAPAVRIWAATGTGAISSFDSWVRDLEILTLLRK
ncbi:hypothetical protein EOA25_00955 [Mesorhizobium sp. M2A.F.Ca.ET.040.01.1.1]|nr:hypothetical protein EOA25_00955 [Mesorhizobium sp. M2A.F.Ca.ET.040.01.1.1]